MTKDVNGREIKTNDKIVFIGGTHAKSVDIPVGMIAEVKDKKVYWENGIVGNLRDGQMNLIKLVS